MLTHQILGGTHTLTTRRLSAPETLNFKEASVLRVRSLIINLYHSHQAITAMYPLCFEYLRKNNVNRKKKSIKNRYKNLFELTRTWDLQKYLPPQTIQNIVVDGNVQLFFPRKLATSNYVFDQIGSKVVSSAPTLSFMLSGSERLFLNI